MVLSGRGSSCSLFGERENRTGLERKIAEMNE